MRDRDARHTVPTEPARSDSTGRKLTPRTSLLELPDVDVSVSTRSVGGPVVGHPDAARPSMRSTAAALIWAVASDRSISGEPSPGCSPVVGSPSGTSSMPVHHGHHRAVRQGGHRRLACRERPEPHQNADQQDHQHRDDHPPDDPQDPARRRRAFRGRLVQAGGQVGRLARPPERRRDQHQANSLKDEQRRRERGMPVPDRVERREQHAQLPGRQQQAHGQPERAAGRHRSIVIQRVSMPRTGFIQSSGRP